MLSRCLKWLQIHRWCLNMSVNSNNPIWFSAGESKHHRRGGGPGLHWSGHWPVWIRSTCCHLFNAARCEVYNPHPHPRHSCSEYAAHMGAERQEKADSAFYAAFNANVSSEHFFFRQIFIGRAVKCSGQNLVLVQTVSKCVWFSDAFVPMLTGVRDEVWSPAHFPWGFASGRRELFWLPW